MALRASAVELVKEKAAVKWWGAPLPPGAPLRGLWRLIGSLTPTWTSVELSTKHWEDLQAPCALWPERLSCWLISRCSSAHAQLTFGFSLKKLEEGEEWLDWGFHPAGWHAAPELAPRPTQIGSQGKQKTISCSLSSATPPPTYTHSVAEPPYR